VTLKTFRLVSLDPVKIHDWVVQLSVLNNKTINLILFNVATTRCIVRYFDSEIDAHLFFTDVVYGDYDVPESEQ
jgi:hypothetical protein